jgi:hypothetical protein
MDLSAVGAVAFPFWKYLYCLSSAVKYLKKGLKILVMNKSEFACAAKHIEPMHIYSTPNSYFYAL